MSRRVIIGILVLLILGILGGTLTLVLSRLQSSTSLTSSAKPEASLLPLDPTGDADNDGLSNTDEETWGSNPTNPDTDGDGFKDGAEVTAGHNPTIAGPNDTLPKNFVPGATTNNTLSDHRLSISDVIDLTTPNPVPDDLKPSPKPLVVDQFFQTGSSPSTGSINLTQQYYRQYNVSSINSDSIAFIKLQPINTQLPTTYEALLKKASTENPTMLRNYIAAVHPGDFLSSKGTLPEIVSDLTTSQDPKRANEWIQYINQYQQRLLGLPVPASAVPLHRLLLGYSELLKTNLNTVAKWEDDEIKALVAIRQIDAADRLYYPLLIDELDRLSVIYSF